MADIKLNDLQPAGSEFFADNEGYLNELSEDELNVWGGGELSVLNSNVSVANSAANSAANSVENSVNISL
ncbi:MAG TPA: hypothetical protein V6C85_24715 [Allocoleopsis sp.]